MGNRAEEGGLSPPPPGRNNSTQQLGPVSLTATKVPLSPGPYNSPPGTPAGPPWAEHSHPGCGSQDQPGVTVATSLQPEERPALERGQNSKEVQLHTHHEESEQSLFSFN